MPAWLPSGWLIVSIFVFVDGSHVLLVVPSCATDIRGTKPERGPRMRFAFLMGLGLNNQLRQVKLKLVWVDKIRNRG